MMELLVIKHTITRNDEALRGMAYSFQVVIVSR